MADLNPQPIPPGAIRVAVPHEILNDLERFQKVQASVLNRAGCPQCTSGLQIDWLHYKDWVVDPAGEVQPVMPNGVIGFSGR